MAPAKLNLGLRLVGRRSDGYHELESLFWPIDFCDEITLKKKETTECSASWAPEAPFRASPLPQGEANLAFHATGGRGWSLHVRKRIPMGAGLGGGSSDAAAVLRHLVQAGEIRQEEATARAVTLGADVPFFLDPAPAFVSGIGERCRRLALAGDIAARLHFLLVLLPDEVPTKRVFECYRRSGRTFSKRADFPPGVVSWDILRAALDRAGNDLEEAAISVCPRIGRVLEELRKSPSLYAGVSGSGATCFAVFDSAETREETVKDLLSPLRTYHCRSIRSKTYTRM